ncbi:MAG TPA: class I lanthipeptide [Thermoanaerobaculia bacterium]|nr:class I lanthipeptide [Thermoanaerobaculia bacterium]
MKKKLTKKKLTLSKETLRSLEDQEIMNAHGGTWTVSFFTCNVDENGICHNHMLTFENC